MTSPSSHPRAKRIHAAAAPPSLCSLTDDLIAEIFLLLPTLADVGRAATACATFRRVIADRAFLRRLRRAHPEPLLGVLSAYSFHPAEPPHRWATAAQALARAADFSFSFIPSAVTVPCRRNLMDARDGRVLLGLDYNHREFAVCDPLSRRYTVLPKIPHEDPAASSADEEPRIELYSAAFLVPAAAAAGEASFKVLWIEEWSHEPPVAFVFSSATGQWSRLAMDGVPHMPELPTERRQTPYYAHGCFYWILTRGIGLFSDEINCDDKLLVLDTRSMEFSTIDLPPGLDYGFHDYAIVEAGEERIGMFCLHKGGVFYSDEAPRIGYATRAVDKEGIYRWRSERTVLTLPSHRNYKVVGATDRCLLLDGCPSLTMLQRSLYDRSNTSETSDVDFKFFSVDFEAMQIARVCQHRSLFRSAMPYSGFPPSLCLPTV